MHPSRWLSVPIDETRLQVRANKNGICKFQLAPFALAHRGGIGLACRTKSKFCGRVICKLVKKSRFDPRAIKHTDHTAVAGGCKRFCRASFHSHENRAATLSKTAGHPVIEPGVSSNPVVRGSGQQPRPAMVSQ